MDADRYFAAVDGIGTSPAVPIEVVAHMPDFARAGADRVLFELSPPEIARSASTCAGPAGGPVAAPPGATVLVTNPGPATDLVVSRWSPVGQVVTELPSGGSVELRFPQDGIVQPYAIFVPQPTARICVSG